MRRRIIAITITLAALLGASAAVAANAGASVHAAPEHSFYHG